jgi:hypothetical protein
MVFAQQNNLEDISCTICAWLVENRFFRAAAKTWLTLAAGSMSAITLCLNGGEHFPVFL